MSASLLDLSGKIDRETDNPKRYRLVEDMMEKFTMSEGTFEECLGHLEGLKVGIREG